MAYNLGTARGQIEITYDSNGTARARADVANLKQALDEVSRNVAEIQINDAQAQARVDQLLHDLQELDRQRADPSVNLSDADARTELDRIRQEIAQLSADSADPSVNIDIDQRSLEQLRVVENQLQALDRLTADPRVDIDTQLANARILETRRNLDELSRQRATPTVDIQNSDGIVAKLAKLRLGLIGVGLALSPALVPIAASLTGAIGGLAAAGSAAAVGLGLVAFAWKSMSKEIMADAGVQEQLTGLKNGWKTLSESIKPQLIQATTFALEGVNQILPLLQPTMTAAGNAVKGLASEFDNFAGGPAVKNFTTFLGQEAGPAITTFGHAALQGITGVMGILQAFQPLIAPIEQGITHLADGFARWGQGLANNPGFQSFLSYVRQAAPLTIQFAKTVVGLGVDIVRSLAPAGLVILHAVTQFGQFLRVIAQSQGWKSFANGVASVIAGLGNFFEKIGQSKEFHAFINALGGALGKFGEFIGKLLSSTVVITLFKTAMAVLTPILHVLGAVFGFLADHMKIVQIVLTVMAAFIVPFGLLFIGLVKVIENLGGVWGAVWGAISAVFHAVWSGISTAFHAVWDAIVAALHGALSGLQLAWNTVWNAISTVFSTVWNAIHLVFTTVWGAISGAFQAGLNALQVIWSTVWNAISLVFSTVWNAISTVFHAVWGFISNLFHTELIGFQVIWNTVWNAISTVFSTVWNGIKTVVGAAVGFIQSVVGGAWNAIQGITSAIWNGIRSVISGVWNGIRSVVSGAVNAVRSVVSGAWNAISGITSSVFNGIRGIASSVWNGIRSIVSGAANAVRSVVSSAFNAAKNAAVGAFNGIISFMRGVGGRILGALGNLGSLLWNAGKSIIEGLLNGIKSAVQGVYNFVSGIAGKIKSLKGPIEYDRSLLIPHGNAIMEGLLTGLQQGAQPMLTYVAGVADQISKNLANVKATAAATVQARTALQNYLTGGDGRITEDDPGWNSHTMGNHLGNWVPEMDPKVRQLEAQLASAVKAQQAAAAFAANYKPPVYTPPVKSPAVVTAAPTAPSRTFAPVFQYVGPLASEVVNEARRQDDWLAGL